MLDARYTLEEVLYPYTRSDAQDRVDHHPVVIVGGGPVGLSLALDIGRRGTPVLLLDDHEGSGQGSRAICFAKRTLEILDRLGAGAVADEGVRWNRGRVFRGEGEVYSFDLLAEPGHKMPAFVNIQQPRVERALVDAIHRAQADGAPITLRGGNRVTGLTQGDISRVEVETRDGPYALTADWVVACDGARSPLRSMLGLGFEGRVFEDNFLIADVRMTAPFPAERWFWFDPPFEGAGASALLHKQPDDIWRIDFQLGWNIDRAAELDPSRVRARIDAMLSHRLGEIPDYDLVWTSIYTFQCRRMQSFREGRVLFAGDAAHQVSPFGARGANSGIQDADALGWRLDAALRGGPEALIDTYCAEREEAADENILNSTRATDFMTPKSAAARRYRDAVLDLAAYHPFARPLVNSGRLSTPTTYVVPGCDLLAGGPHATRPGAPCPDAPLEGGFLLEALDAVAPGFALLTLGRAEAPDPGALPIATFSVPMPGGALRARFLGKADGAIYLLRPDRHVAARFRDCDGPTLATVFAAAGGLLP